MYIKNSYVAFVFRVIVLALCAISLVAHFSLTDSVNNSKMIAYFTLQSVLLCFCVFIPITINTFYEIKEKNMPFYRYKLSTLKGMATMAIILTFLSYQFMLADTGFSMYSYGSLYSFIKDNLVHFVIPVMVVLDWLLFSPKGLYRWYDPLVWLIFPFAYLLFVLFRAFSYPNSTFLKIPKYPYFFLNVDKLGLPKVMIFVCIFIAFILIIGIIMFAVDYLLAALRWKYLQHLEKKQKSTENADESAK